MKKISKSRSPLYAPALNCLLNLNSIMLTMSIVLPRLIQEEKVRQKKIAKLDKIYQQYQNQPSKSGLKAEEVEKIYRAVHRVGEEKKRAGRGLITFSDGSFLNVFSIYDAYITQVFRMVYKKNPNLLNPKSVLCFNDLVDSGVSSFRGVQERFIEQEIETYRANRKKQLNRLEELLKEKFITSVGPSMKDFCEASEVRNLLAHHRGRITNQYLKNMRAEGAVGGKKVGERIIIKARDFRRYYQSILKVVIEITYALLPSDVEKKEFTDLILSEVVFEQIRGKQNKEAIYILEILRGRGLTEDLFLANKLLALRGSKIALDKRELKTTLKRLLLVSDDLIYKILVEVVKENYDSATILVKEIDNYKLFKRIKYLITSPDNGLAFEEFSQMPGTKKLLSKMDNVEKFK